MKRTLWTLAAVCLLAIPVICQTVTVTANLRALTGSNVTTGAYFKFTLKAFNGNPVRIAGTAWVDVQPVTARPDSSGNISVALLGNDTLTSYIVNDTYYQVCVFDAGQQLYCAPFKITGTWTYNLNTQSPLSLTPPVGVMPQWWVPMAGGAMTGPLQLYGDPVTPNGAATKNYVDSHAGSGGTISGISTGSTSGLTGGGLSGLLNLSLRMDCLPTQTVIWSGSGWGCGNSGAVATVFGRAGSVTAQSGDYGVAQITGAAPVASPSFTGNGAITGSWTAQTFASSNPFQVTSAVASASPSSTSGTQSFGFGPGGLLQWSANGGAAQTVMAVNSNISGNAGTSSAFDHTPTLCSSGVATGVDVNGNAVCSASDLLQLAERTAPTGVSGFGQLWFGTDHLVHAQDNTTTLTLNAYSNLLNADTGGAGGGSTNVLEEANGNNTQSFRVYHTTDGTNYTRLNMRYAYDSTNNINYQGIFSEYGGSGSGGGNTAYNIGFGVGGTSPRIVWEIANSSPYQLRPSLWGGATSGSYDIGDATHQIRDLYLGRALFLNGSAGSVGQCPISAGPGAAAAWGACGSGGSMTWPSGGAGIPNYNGSSGWGTTYNASNTIPANFISTLNQNTSGNAATASALASTPTLCSPGQAPTGVLANGNATGCASIGGGGTVSSVFGRTGTVTAQSGDYAASQVTNAAATNVGNTFTGNQTFNGDVTVNGQINLGGSGPNESDFTVNSVALNSPASGKSGFGFDTTANGGLFKYYENGGAWVGLTAALAGKQGSLTLTTTGSSGAASLVGNTLNIPQYSGGSGMTWPSGGAGIPNYSGSSTWGSSYNASNTIPANFIPTLNQSTSGNAATATTTTNIAGGSVGSIPYQTGAGATAMLSGNTASTDQVLTSTGTGSSAQAPTLKNAPAISAANMTSFPSSLETVSAAQAAFAGHGACTNQAVTAENANASPTCTTLTSAYVDNTVATVSGGGSLVTGDYAKANGASSVTDSGVLAGPYSIPWITAVRGGGTVSFTQNTATVWGVVLTFPLSTSQLTYKTTVDNTSNLYDIGIACAQTTCVASGGPYSSGQLILDLGATAGTSFSSSATYFTKSWTQGTRTLQPGRYYLVLTTNCASACATITAGGSSGDITFISAGSGGSTSGGAIVNFTPPSDTWSWGSNLPALVIRWSKRHCSWSEWKHVSDNRTKIILTWISEYDRISSVGYFNRREGSALKKTVYTLLFLLSCSLLSSAGVSEIRKDFSNISGSMAATSLLTAPGSDANYLLCIVFSTASQATTLVRWTDENGLAQSYAPGSGHPCNLIRNKANTAPTVETSATNGQQYSFSVFGLGFWPGQSQKQGGLQNVVVDQPYIPQGNYNYVAEFGWSYPAPALLWTWNCPQVGVSGYTPIWLPVNGTGTVLPLNANSTCSTAPVVIAFGNPSSGDGPLVDYEYNLLRWTNATNPNYKTVLTAGSAAVHLLFAANVAEDPNAGTVNEGVGFLSANTCGSVLATPPGVPSTCVSPAVVSPGTSFQFDTFNSPGSPWGSSPTYSAEVDVIQFWWDKTFFSWQRSSGRCLSLWYRLPPHHPLRWFLVPGQEVAPGSVMWTAEWGLTETLAP
jgi:hypothetical protein